MQDRSTPLRSRNLVRVLLLVACVCYVNGLRRCTLIDSCSCRFDDDGSSMSLRSIASYDGRPMFNGVGERDNTSYWFNPCEPFNVDGCHNAAFCKKESVENATTELLANQKDAFAFDYLDNRTLEVTYHSEDGPGEVAVLSVICVEKMDTPLFKALGRARGMPPYHYDFEIQSKCGCPGECPYISREEDDSLSAGSVMLILFFVFVFLYLVIGTIHGKVSRNESGLRMLPNYDFWVSLPGMTKDGCLYVVRCACCTPTQKKYDEV